VLRRVLDAERRHRHIGDSIQTRRLTKRVWKISPDRPGLGFMTVVCLLVNRSAEKCPIQKDGCRGNLWGNEKKFKRRVTIRITDRL